MSDEKRKPRDVSAVENRRLNMGLGAAALGVKRPATPDINLPAVKRGALLSQMRKK